jgi:hypothetical protein
VKRRRGRGQTGRLVLEELEPRVMPAFVAAVPAINPFDNFDGVQAVGSSRTVTEATSGAYRVVWHDTIPNVGGIYTQLFASNNQALTPPTLVGNTTSSDKQETIAGDANGDAVVAWTHTNADGTTLVKAQVITADGTMSNVWTVSGSGGFKPSVAMSDASDILIAYQSNSGGTPTVAVSHGFEAANVFNAFTSQTITNAAAPSIAVNSRGAGILAYTRDNSSNDHILYAQPMDSRGDAIGGAVLVGGSLPVNIISEPSVAIDSQGDFDVAYTYVVNQTTTSNPPFGFQTVYQSDVHVARFDSSNNFLGNIAVTQSTSNTDSGYNPCLTMDPAGNIVVACTVGNGYGTTTPEPGNSSLLVKAYAPDGTFLQPVYLPAPNTNSLADFLPSVALNASGQLVASFADLTPGQGHEFNPFNEQVYVQPFVGEPYQLQLIGNRTINLYTGAPSALVLADITPEQGFSGQVSLTFPPLPAGITANVTPVQTLGQSDSRYQVTFTADPSITSFESFTTSFDLTSPGALTVVSPTFQINVTPSAITNVWPAGPNQGEKGIFPGLPAAIQGAGFLPGSTVQFTLTGPFVGSTTVETPTSLDANGIIVPVPDNFKAGSTITVLRPGATSLTSSPIAIAPPMITSLSTTQGFAPGYSAQYLSAGSSLTIYGAGFRPGSKVQFGIDSQGATNPIDPNLLTPVREVRDRSRCGCRPHVFHVWGRRTSTSRRSRHHRRRPGGPGGGPGRSEIPTGRNGRMLRVPRLELAPGQRPEPARAVLFRPARQRRSRLGHSLRKPNGEQFDSNSRAGKLP